MIIEYLTMHRTILLYKLFLLNLVSWLLRRTTIWKVILVYHFAVGRVELSGCLIDLIQLLLLTVVIIEIL